MSVLYNYQIILTDDIIRVEDSEGNFFERILYPCEYQWTSLAQLLAELSYDIDFQKE